MVLTLQEREAVVRGDLVSFKLAESGLECVVARRDVVDRMGIGPSPGREGECEDSVAQESTESEGSPPRRRDPTSIIGLWKDANPLSDEEIDRILEEELIRKHC